MEKNSRKKDKPLRTRSRKKGPAAVKSSTQIRRVPKEGIRLNRYIAQAGICSRRKADELIAAGQVRVNEKTIQEMGVRVMPGDVVEVGGKRITPQDHEYILLNKPTDTITTNQDERGRKIVLDLIDDDQLGKAGVFPVGRLDRHTVGALLITNDGELAHRLMHPSYEIEKLYIARTKEVVPNEDLEKMHEGVTIEGEVLKVDAVEYVGHPKNKEIGIRLHEGKNRHIRRLLEALGHRTVFLERVRYAGLTTEGIRRGKWRRLNSREIKRLRRLVKLK